MITHILFPTDGSKNSQIAQKYVEEMACKFGAKVTVLSAYEFSGSVILGRYDVNLEYLNYVEEQLQHHAEELTSHVKKDLSKNNIPVEIKIIRGDIGETIAQVANTGLYDVVIMGSRGLSGLKSMLLGSVSNYVVHHVKCPVLVVPMSQSERNH